MRSRHQVVILLVVIAVLAVYLYRRSDDRTLYTLPSLPAASAADLTRIEISRGGETVVLKRQEDRWRIEPKMVAVDRKAATGMLDAIAGLKVTAVVAESKNFALYELDEEHGIHVKAFQGDRLLRDFTIGKIAPSYRHTFVRLAGDDRVFHALDAFRDRFAGSIDEMRDKTVLSFQPRDIQELTVAARQRSLTLQRGPAKAGAGEAGGASEWKTPQGQEVKAALVEDLLGQLSALRCEKFIPDRPKSDFTKPILTVTLRSGEVSTFSLFAPEEKTEDKPSPALTSAGEEPFLLAGFQATAIVKKAEDLLAAAPQAP